MATLVATYKVPALWQVTSGTTLTGYKWSATYNKEVGPRKTAKWAESSTATATAEYRLINTSIPSGTYLYVSNGYYAGYIIPKDKVKILSGGTFGLPHSTDPLAYPARYQFGQSGAPCGGRSCCTDTCLQMIIEYWLEQPVTLMAIRKASGETDMCDGLSPTEAKRALNYFGITWYQWFSGASGLTVLSKLQAGYTPILVPTHYGSYPNSTSGKCGNSNKAEYSGRTDCSFRGAHAVLAEKAVAHTNHYDIITRDPDHNSVSRPEKPLYDRITTSQLDRAMKNIVPYTNWSTTGILYPTRKKTL